MRKHLFLSPLGILVLFAHNGKLIYCNWDDHDCRNKESKIIKTIGLNRELYGDKEVLEEAAVQLKEYFSGDRKKFEIPLSLYGTDFQINVWNNISTVPYGQTMTYAQLGKMCGRESLARAVASACGANPISVILPCHRITAAHNRLGGYTGGLDKKIGLLTLEKSNV